MYFKFTENDKFINTLVANPEYEIVITSGSIWINNSINQGLNVNSASVSIYEINVNRSAGLVYPYITKGGDYERLGTVTESEFHSASYGSQLTGTYPVTASMKITNYQDMTATRVTALKNPVDSYRKNSQKFNYENLIVNTDLTIVELPRLFCGSSIKKGSVELEYYYTGTLAAKIIDDRLNGDLILSEYNANNTSLFVSGATVPGVVLYNEGIILLDHTGSFDVEAGGGWGGSYSPAWINFGLFRGTAGTDDQHYFRLKFRGTTKTPIKTMFCHAPMFYLNNSTNPTIISRDETLFVTSSNARAFVENEFMDIQNLASSSYAGVTSSFEKITRISQIGLYDKNKKLIGMAKLANPLIKKEDQGYTFKLKLDL